jgi:hypothetical protein
LVIENTTRKIVTDLCQRGRVWEDDLSNIAVTPAGYTYTLTPAVAYAEVIEPTRLYSVRADNTQFDIHRVNRAKMLQLHRGWPADDSGEPQHYQSGASTDIVMLAPVPDAAITVRARAQLRPTAAAAEWPDYLYREHHRAVFHGVLHELMGMPGRSWSDAKLAVYHGKQWTYLLSQATIRASQEYSADELVVEMRPFA